MPLDDLFIQKPEDSSNCSKLCAEYIGGPWINLKDSEFECKLVPGGLCNRVFVCQNKKLTGKGTTKMPEKVLVRTYGSDFVGRRGDMVNVDDAALPLIQEILWEKGLGPKLFGVFDGGRIEEFIEHDNIDPKERQEMKYLNEIMKKIALVHSLEMPISKKPYGVFNLVKKWFQDGRDNNELLFKPGSVEPELEKYREELASFDWAKEMDWFEKCLPLVNSRPVFNHNDIQYANIFLRRDGKTLEEKIFIFDYENCSYGFRGYDLAFFLYAKSVDFFVPEFWKNVFWPEQSDVCHLLSLYLTSHLKNLPTIDPEVDTLEHLCMEVDFFLLLVLLLRLCVCYKKLSNTFQEVLHYSNTEIARYNERKKILLQKYPILAETNGNVQNGKDNSD